MGAHGPLWARTMGPMGPGPGPWALWAMGQDHGPYGPRAWTLYFSAIVPYIFFYPLGGSVSDFADLPYIDFWNF